MKLINILIVYFIHGLIGSFIGTTIASIISPIFRAKSASFVFKYILICAFWPWLFISILYIIKTYLL